MTVLVLPLLLLIAGTAGGRWFRLRRRDEKSIEAHRNTLYTIEHVAGAEDRPGVPADRMSGHVRVLGASGRSGHPSADDEVLPSKPPQWRSNRPSFPRPSEPEAARLIAGPPLPSPAPRDIPRATAARRHMRLSGAVASAAVALAAVALTLAAVLGLVLHSGGRHPATSAARRPATPAGRPTPTGPSHRVASASGAAPAIVATSADASYATYTVHASPFDLVLTTSRPCWAQVRSGSAAGAILYEGTMGPGISHAFQAATSVWLRLGDPSGVKLSIDGSLLTLPSVANPFDVAVIVPA